MQYHDRDGPISPHPAGDSRNPLLRVDFDRHLKLEFHGSKITSDAGLLAYRELDEVLGLTDLGGTALSDLRRGKNTRHLLTGLLRQSVYSRLAGYEDVNDAERLSRDPAMRAIVDRKGLDRHAASTSQMGRFETEWLATEENLASLTNLSGIWSGACYVLATSTAPRIGGWCWNRSLRAIASDDCGATFERTPRSRSRRSTSSWKPKVTHTLSVSRPTRSCRKASPTC